jgi:hypothetical protein
MITSEFFVRTSNFELCLFNGRIEQLEECRRPKTNNGVRAHRGCHSWFVAFSLLPSAFCLLPFSLFHVETPRCNAVFRVATPVQSFQSVRRGRAGAPLIGYELHA